MENTCKFTSLDATNLVEFIDKTVIVHTKQSKCPSKGVVYTVDPVTKSIVLINNGQYKILSGINIENVQTEKK